jgi:hypothetical protein
MAFNKYCWSILMKDDKFDTMGRWGKFEQNFGLKTWMEETNLKN